MLDNCNIKIILFSTCIIFSLVGLYLSFFREKKDIKAGATIPQTASASKDGFSFALTIGLILIVLGFGGAFASAKYIPGCEIHKTDSSKIIITTPEKKNYKVKGTVEDEANGHRIASAKVVVKGTKDSGETGSDGIFDIELSENKDEVWIEVTADGYEKYPPTKYSTASNIPILLSKK